MAINNLGNGNGFIYITDSSGNIMSNIVNNTQGKKAVLKDALINAALADEASSLYEDRRYHLNISGVEGSISGATDITQYITNVGLNSRFVTTNASVSAGLITYTRGASIQRIVIDTQSNAAADNLIYLRESNSLVSDGDIIILVGENSSRVTSVLDANSSEASTENSGSAPTGIGYFELDSNTAFHTNTGNYTLMLQYNATVKAWYEINRAPGAVLTDEKIREAGINFPKKGVYLISSVTAGGSFTPTVDVTAGLIQVSGTHNISAGNFTINKPAGGTPREGDKFVILWRANVTTTGVISLFDVVLESRDYGSGATAPIEIVTRYIDGAWQSGVVRKDTKALAAEKEDVLGNPSSDGFFLTSSAAGVRAWSPINTGLKIATFRFDVGMGMGAVTAEQVLGLSSRGAYLPKGAIIDADNSFVQVLTALTGGTGATIALGIKVSGTTGGSQPTDNDFFLAQEVITGAPWTAANSVRKLQSHGVGQIENGVGIVTAVIGTAAITAGKFNVIVAYYES